MFDGLPHGLPLAVHFHVWQSLVSDRVCILCQSLLHCNVLLMRICQLQVVPEWNRSRLVHSRHGSTVFVGMFTKGRLSVVGGTHDGHIRVAGLLCPRYGNVGLLPYFSTFKNTVSLIRMC